MSKQHKHAVMIKQWAEDTTRIIEYTTPYTGMDGYTYFKEWKETRRPTWEEGNRYRFADEYKYPVVSSLTDQTIKQIVKDSESRLGGNGDHYRTIANLAAQREREDICQHFESNLFIPFHDDELRVMVNSTTSLKTIIVSLMKNFTKRKEMGDKFQKAYDENHPK